MQMFKSSIKLVTVPIVRNLYYVYLCNDFFTGIMESANY